VEVDTLHHIEVHGPRARGVSQRTCSTDIRWVRSSRVIACSAMK
jgi:hypothetical protein